MRDLNNLDVTSLYERTKASSCLTRKGNEFLVEEVSLPLDQILVKEDSLRVTLRGFDKSEYLVETKLILLSDDNTSLGYYCLHENEKCEVIDDFLVFE